MEVSGDAAAGPDVIGSGSDSAGWGGWEQRHRRGLRVGLAALVVIAAAGYGWQRLHPPAMSVPTISVLVDPTTAQVAQSGPAVTSALNLPVQLVLDLHAVPDDGVQVIFVGLVGPGAQSPVQPALAVSGNRRVTVYTEVSCATWKGATRLAAQFRVTDGSTIREVRAPILEQGRSLADEVVQTSCTNYESAHPVEVSAVSATLDPALPLVHLVWRLANHTVADWALDGGAGLTSDTPQPEVVLGPDSPTYGLVVPAHGSATATSSVQVADCGRADQLGAAAAGIHLSLGLTASSAGAGLSSAEADLPSDQLATVFALLQHACAGAPRVDNPSVVFNRHVSGKVPSLEMSVRAQIEGTAAWTLRVGLPPWAPDGDQDPTRPVASAHVQAPALADVALPVALAICPDVFGSTGPTAIPWTLTGGGRTYPFVAVVHLQDFSGGGPCVTR